MDKPWYIHGAWGARRLRVGCEKVNCHTPGPAHIFFIFSFFALLCSHTSRAPKKSENSNRRINHGICGNRHPPVCCFCFAEQMRKLFAGDSRGSPPSSRRVSNCCRLCCGHPKTHTGARGAQGRAACCFCTGSLPQRPMPSYLGCALQARPLSRTRHRNDTVRSSSHPIIINSCVCGALTGGECCCVSSITGQEHGKRGAPAELLVTHLIDQISHLLRARQRSRPVWF